MCLIGTLIECIPTQRVYSKKYALILNFESGLLVESCWYFFLAWRLGSKEKFHYIIINLNS